MAASLSGVYNLQSFTDLGALAAGYRLYTYAAGTTTQKTAYTDAAGTVPHTYTSDGAGGLYIALNSRGELPAPLFLTSGGYDIALKTAAGSTVWTRRAIGGDDASSSLQALLLLSSGAGMSGFLPTVAYSSQTVGYRLAQEIHLSDFTGADDYTKFAAWVAAVNASTAPGVIAVIDPGNYSIASASLGAGLTITRDNVQVVGVGYPSITITGGSVTTCVFGSAGRNRISYSGIRFFGNAQANAYANGIAISYTNSSTADIRDFSVTDCYFENFKGDYWVYVEALGSKKISGVRVHGNTFKSLTGNARGPATITINSAFVGIIGNSANSTSPVENIWIERNEMDAQFIKTGVQIFQFCQNFHIRANTILNAGQSEVSNDCGAYAIMVYESSGTTRGNTGEVSFNIIRSPRSCGIYHANRYDGMVYAHNQINGQTDTVTATLPKGGIVMNGALRPSVIGGQISNCAADGIFWLQPSDAATDALVMISGVTINACLNGVHIQSANQASRNVSVLGNVITECTAGIQLDLFTSAVLSNVKLSGNRIRSAVANSYGVQILSADASYKINDLTISDNEIAATLTGIRASTCTTGTIAIRSNRIVGNYTAYGMDLRSSTKLVVQLNEFNGQTTVGFCVGSNSARGTLESNTFQACATAQIVENSGGEDLGRSTPTWVPDQNGVFVQNLQPAEAGSASSKYVNFGWRYASAWLQQRALTGN